MDETAEPLTIPWWIWFAMSVVVVGAIVIFVLKSDDRSHRRHRSRRSSSRRHRSRSRHHRHRSDRDSEAPFD